MRRQTIALIAHDARKLDLIEWAKHNIEKLSQHKLVCTGTTGRLVKELFEKNNIITEVVCLKSGPLGGDQQIGALIAEDKIDLILFLADNLSMQPHDTDIKALSRLAQLYNIPMACNRSTADYIISSPLFSDSNYERKRPSFDDYVNRKI